MSPASPHGGEKNLTFFFFFFFLNSCWAGKTHPDLVVPVFPPARPAGGIKPIPNPAHNSRSPRRGRQVALPWGPRGGVVRYHGAWSLS